MVLYDRSKRRKPTPPPLPLNLNDITSRCTQLAGQMVIDKLGKELGNGSALPLEVAGTVVSGARAKFTVAA